MEMYNALKCPEEEVSTTIDASTTTTTTTEEPEPKVIIKNPQKMMEDIFDSLDSDVVLDSNRLEETNVQHKVDLDLMMGDQPMPDVEVVEDKKVVLKQPEKKEFYAKKSKQKSEKLKAKDEDEPMMGDAPCLPCAAKAEQTTLTPTTDRQRRDANLLESTTTTATAEVSTSESTTEVSDESSSIVSSTELPQSPSTTEQIVTTTVIEETTTKFYVQGHPLHMSQAIFKEPIQPDIHNTHERIDIGKDDAGFIPPMLLVKAKTTTTTPEPVVKETLTTDISTDQTLIDVTDVADENSTIIVTPKTPENVSESALPTVPATQLENTITTVAASEKPILIEKRNDPRLGLKAVTTTASITPTTQQNIVSSTAVELTTVSEDMTSVSDNTESTFEANTSAESAITTEETLATELLDTSSPSAAVSDTSKSLEIVASPSTTQEESVTAEKLILSTLATEQTVEPSTTIMSSSSSATPIALKQTTVTINKSTTTMRNDIDAYRHSEDGSHEDDEMESAERRHMENNFSNADYQPYKPNRHRSVIKPDHHHGPGFSIGKILG